MKLKLFVIVLALAVGIGGAYLAYDHFSQREEEPQAPPSEETKENPAAENPPEQDPMEESPATPALAAMDFTVFDADGNAVRLSDYFGKPIVLNFFSIECAPCLAELPDFQAEYSENRDEVHFLFVNLDYSFDSVLQYAAREGYDFPILHDRIYSAAIAYTVTTIPATYFIDRDGYIVTRSIGWMSREEVALGIAQIK